MRPYALRSGAILRTVTITAMARRSAPKLKLNLAKALKPKKSPLMSALLGKDQRGNPTYSRRYDLMRFPKY